MDYWPSLELTPKTLRQFVLNVDSMKKILENKEQCNLFFNRFPFDQMFNFTIMDKYSIRLCIRIFELFISYEEFCNVEERVNYVIEFTLINLNQAMEDCKEVVPLFQLLVKILHRNICTLDSSFKNLFDRERIMEVMLKLTNFRSIQKTNFLLFSSVLKLLLQNDFSDSLNCLLAKLFDKFHKHNVLKAQLVVCKLVLNSEQKLLCKSFENIWKWLVEKCPIILIENVDVVLLDEIIYCLVTFIGNWAALNCNDNEMKQFLYHYIEEIINSLRKYTSHICMLTSDKIVKKGCFKLLKFILMKFLNEENFTMFEQTEILKSFYNFPENVETWPNVDNDVFFCICQICVENNKLIWKPTDVLYSIMRFFYNRKNVIKTFVLKSIYYLYPALIEHLEIDFSIKVLGDDLLNYFEKVCTVSCLYSYNAEQLKWILDRATKSTKLTVISQWLKTTEDNSEMESILIETIKNCNAQIILLQLMVEDDNLGTRLGFRIAGLLKQIQNCDVSSIINSILPFSIERPTSFYNLLLTEPSFFLSDSKDLVLICSLIGALIPSLYDVEILKGVCVFSCKLLLNHKDNFHSVKGFCQNITNIKYLIETIDKVDDDTGVEIIRLLKTILLLQQKHKLILNLKINQNFLVFMKGSSEKIKKGLTLLYYALICKNALIAVDTDNILEIHHMLLNYSLDSLLQPIASQCIIVLIRRVPWVAQTISTSIYVEMTCLSYLNSTFQANFLKFLDIWLTLLRRESYNGFCPFPETAIRSFILRLNLPNEKKQKYFTLLEDLSKKANVKHKLNVFSRGS